MTDIPYPSDYERLRGNIREELVVQCAMRDLDFDEVAIDGLAEAIAVNVEYAFSVTWAPRWVSGDGPHRWAEPPGDSPTRWLVECLRCKRITAHASPADADQWWEHHRQAHS